MDTIFLAGGQDINPGEGCRLIDITGHITYNFTMNTPPTVTVIVATYNRSNVLSYSVASALNQTCANIEVLVIGDGCTDDSEEVVKDMADERVRWIGLTENNGHQSKPNNVGLSEARGKFIAYLGHDDLWLPHHLEVCTQRLDQGCDLAFALTLMVAENKGKNDLRPAKGRYKPGLWIPPSGMVHRKTVTDSIGGWADHREIKGNPEADLWRRAHRAGFEFAFVPRLSVVKISAGARKNVYRKRSEHEQAHWYTRIQNEADLEQTEMALCYTKLYNLDIRYRAAMPYKKLLSYFWFRTRTEFMSRVPVLKKRVSNDIDVKRKYKGLRPKALNHSGES